MNDLINLLSAAGLGPTPLVIDGAEVELTWPASVPVVDDRVIVVLPDLHLSDGGNADIFRGTSGDAHRKRLEGFLAVLIAFRAQLKAVGRELKVILLGDSFDVWRAYPFHERDRGRTYDAIFTEYRDVVARLIDGLDARFCVGNHDAIMAHHPPDWAFGANSRLGYSQRLCSGTVFCMHGHQTDDLVEAPIADSGQVWVALGSSLCVLTPEAQWIQQAIDQHEDAYPGDDGGYPEGVPPVDSPFKATRWSDRGRRKDRMEKIFEAMAIRYPSIAGAVRLAVVGHTHRPGIAWFVRGQTVVPVIDVGSWTYGKTQFAVITQGSAKLWRLG